MNKVVPELLEGRNNYGSWSACMKTYLVANDLWDIIESTADSPTPQVNKAEFEVWEKNNATALHAIQISCARAILLQIKDITSAKLCWNTLADLGVTLNVTTQTPPTSQVAPLREAIYKGDLEAVKDFIHHHPDLLGNNLDVAGRKAIHIACLTGNTKIVQTLVDFMSEDDLKMADKDGMTALIYAAGVGSMKIVDIIVRKNNTLVSVAIPGTDNLPVATASICGRKEIVRYLYFRTPFDLLLQRNGAYGSFLLHHTITGQIFDVAFDLLQRCPSLATTVNSTGTNPLLLLAALTNFFPSGSHFVFWKRWIYSRIRVQLPGPVSDVRISISEDTHMKQGNLLRQGLKWLPNLILNFMESFGIKEIYDQKMTHECALKVLHYMAQHLSTIDNTELESRAVLLAFQLAIRGGVIEVVVQMIKTKPSLPSISFIQSGSMLLIAVQFRQEKIFSLVNVLDNLKFLLLSGHDKDNNNILHLAAMLAPSYRLAHISGAALRMQRELQWYKEVERIVSPEFKFFVNKSQRIPGEIFSTSHRTLMEDGEKWMKETATSCTVVGALIITIMFTAVFTVPGGNDQETGFPQFRHEKSFRIFLIFVAISLFASSTSVLTFLGVLTSRYSEEDFLKSLPTKLIIGLLTLFISLAAMMVAFCAAIILMLRHELKVVMPIVLLASVPVTLFILQQFPLPVEMFMSTYGSGIIDKKLKYWQLNL